jgi:hypothetical protein
LIEGVKTLLIWQTLGFAGLAAPMMKAPFIIVFKVL